MTVLAMFLSPDTVTFAADSVSCGANSERATHHPKLQVNQLARIVCAGTGFAGVLTAAYAVCTEASSFDEALPKVTQALRKVARDLAHFFDEDPRAFAKQTFVVAGWSGNAGRMVAYTFCGWSFFVPILAGNVVLPDVTGLPELWRPRSLADMVNLCREQARVLMADNPRAGEGTLFVCTLKQHETNTVSVPDYIEMKEFEDGLS